MRRCSFVAPDGPAAAPRRADRRHATKAGSGNGQVSKLESDNIWRQRCTHRGRAAIRIAKLWRPCLARAAGRPGLDRLQRAPRCALKLPRGHRHHRACCRVGGVPSRNCVGCLLQQFRPRPASPAARKTSMRGARQNSFQPRSSSCGDSRSVISCKPARSAVRNALRRQVGTPCKVRIRWRNATSRVIASREASRICIICMPAAAAAVRLSRGVLRAGTSEGGTSLAEAAGRTEGTPGSSGAVEAAATAPRRPLPRPSRRPRPVARIAAAAARAEASRWDWCPFTLTRAGAVLDQTG